MKKLALIVTTVLSLTSSSFAENNDLDFNDVMMAYWETVFIAHLCDPYIPTGQPFVIDQIAEELRGFGLEEFEIEDVLNSARRRGDKAGEILKEEEAKTPHAAILYCTETYQKRLDKLNEIREQIFTEET